MNESLSQAGNDLVALAQTGAAQLSDLPWGAHVGAGITLVAGICLLIAGRKLLRMALILGAAALGGVFCFYAGPTIGIPADPNILLAIGLALGAIAGILLYRATVSVTTMLLLAAAGPLIAAGIMRLAPTQEWRPAPSDDPAPTELVASLSDAEQEQIIEEARERVRAFSKQVREKAGAEWNELDGREKSVLAGSSMLGAALGLLLGMMYPKRCAAVMSSFMGAALILPSSVWLIEASSPAAAERLPTDAMVWLALWGGLSVVGAAVQWTGTRRKTDS